MSVERMEMMNVIGYISDLDKVSAEIVKSGCVHIVNALNEINQNDFTVMTPDQNTNVLMNLSFIKQYVKYNESSSLNEKLNELMNIFSISPGIKKAYMEGSLEYESISRNIEYIHNIVADYHRKLESTNDEIKKMEEFQDDMKHIRNVSIDMNTLRDLRFFSFKIGKLSKENYDKLMDNIENVSSIIYELSTIPGYEVIMSLTPKVLENEVDRIFKSLNYEELNIVDNLEGTPEEIIKMLDGMVAGKKEEAEKIIGEISKLKDKYSAYIDESYSRLKLYEKIQGINSEVACTNEFFYMAGWIPVSEKVNMQRTLESFGDRLILIFKPQSEVSSSILPPTRLKNNWLVRPFETLVAMYGTPSYNEMDPTSFVSISYMIMFGAMFGDIGQGLVFLLTGIIMSLKNRESNFGGILSRLGVSSMVFGALFGSVFGNENIFPHLLLKPLDNINIVLIGGVVLGIAFTTVGFLYNLVNAVKMKDMEDGVFGKDGLVGLLFYWIILLTALSMYRKTPMIVPLPGVITMLCILLGLMVLKQPLTNLIQGNKPLYHEHPQDYYIESGFGVIETLLSMLSNTISFIRVGAFALNHVGLFVAFATIADMMKTRVGSAAMLVLGNVIIIGLEGLIVFIQGLRLEYYELFSKYYKGDGIEYSPVKIKYTNKAPLEKNKYANINLNESSTVNI